MDIAEKDRFTQGIHLAPNVVNVIFLKDSVITYLENIGQDIADCRSSPMSNVQWSGRIGAYEFDLNSPTLPYFTLAEALPPTVDLPEDGIPHLFFQKKIDESGAGDFRFFDHLIFIL